MGKLELAKKIKALADGGVGGEAENAKRILDDYIKKHGITEEDLNDDKKIFCFFDIEYSSYRIEKGLLIQLCAIMDIESMYSDVPRHIIKGAGGVGNCAVECTTAQSIELKLKFEFYKSQLIIRLSEFMTAFYMKNELMKVREENPSDPSDKEEVARQMKALRIAQGMERSDYYKQIGENRLTK